MLTTPRHQNLAIKHHEVLGSIYTSYSGGMGSILGPEAGYPFSWISLVPSTSFTIHLTITLAFDST
jgi:biotin transporter BioY